MATPTPPGLTPSESAFLAESELVTVVPRSALPSISLLAGPTPELRPPHRAAVPLWLALLLKKQGRANVVPPLWLNAGALEAVLAYENANEAFAPAPRFAVSEERSEPGAVYPTDTPMSPPFQPTSTLTEHGAEELPYHYLELAHLLLDNCADDIPDADNLRRLLRDVREARAAKLRKGVGNLAGDAQVVLSGVGALEVAEHRAFIGGVVDGLRVVGGSKEAARREREERQGGYGGADEDEDML